jgi:hypothetical protein
MSDGVPRAIEEEEIPVAEIVDGAEVADFQRRRIEVDDFGLAVGEVAFQKGRLGVGGVGWEERLLDSGTDN